MRLIFSASGYEKIFEAIRKVEASINRGIQTPENAIENLREARTGLFGLQRVIKEHAIIEPDKRRPSKEVPHGMDRIIEAQR